MTTLLVAGLTGSGKTSASRALAASLGCQWVSGSDLRRRFFGLDGKDVGAPRLSKALSEGNLRLEEARMRQTSGESEFDAELLRLATSLENAVFDVWFLPWFTPNRAVVSVLLRASLMTRAHRVSEMMKISREDAAVIVSEKDERARQYARRQYGVDIDHDHIIFDAVLDTDSLTTADVVNRLRVLAERQPRHGT